MQCLCGFNGSAGLDRDMQVLFCVWMTGNDLVEMQAFWRLSMWSRCQCCVNARLRYGATRARSETEANERKFGEIYGRKYNVSFGPRPAWRPFVAVACACLTLAGYSCYLSCTADSARYVSAQPQRHPSIYTVVMDRWSGHAESQDTKFSARCDPTWTVFRGAVFLG